MCTSEPHQTKSHAADTAAAVAWPVRGPGCPCAAPGAAAAGPTAPATALVAAAAAAGRWMLLPLLLLLLLLRAHVAKHPWRYI